jgi:DNA-binding MarR family transcriptional regulator
MTESTESTESNVESTETSAEQTPSQGDTTVSKKKAAAKKSPAAKKKATSKKVTKKSPAAKKKTAPKKATKKKTADKKATGAGSLVSPGEKDVLMFLLKKGAMTAQSSVKNTAAWNATEAKGPQQCVSLREKGYITRSKLDDGAEKTLHLTATGKTLANKIKSGK